MSNSRFPRIVGFDVPRLQAKVDNDLDAPVVALLDIAPSENWVVVFEREVRQLTGELGVADVTIEGDRVMFFGSIKDSRRLSDAVRALVDRISRIRMEERFHEAGNGSVRGGDAGQGDG